MNLTYLDNYEKWLSSDSLSAEEKAELNAISGDDREIRERFSFGLTFGTGGLRGIMKTGMNAMNVHTVAQATQGLANHILKCKKDNGGVVVGRDSRINSELFAKTAARVLAANGIKVYIFRDIQPTPELSFALRRLGCTAGVNITASHNPKEYNGYKAYWEDGAQLSLDDADAVKAEIDATDVFADVKYTDFDEAVEKGLITYLGEEMDEAYLAAVKAEAVNPDVISADADNLKIVYSPLHGTGYKLVPELLRSLGLKNLYVVPEQAEPDGTFPTVKKPNPEYRETLSLGIGLANKVGSDLMFANDPDADRMGAVARAKDGSFVTITGNQMGALLLDYILTAYEETGTMPKEPYAVKTIVSTELVTRICRAHGIRLYNVLTGFKFIAEVIKKREAEGHGTFVFGFEESYGYMKGTYARDKDGVVAAMLVCEMTAYYKLKGMTLIDALEALWAKTGYSLESTDELYIEGLDAAEKIKAIMEKLREDPPKTLGGVKVEAVGDYLKGEFTDTATGKKSPTGLPESNVMYFRTETGDVVIARPSGTEPKIKFYYLVSSSDKEHAPALLEAYKASIATYKN